MASSPYIVLITGANRGIGWEVVRALCSSSKTFCIILAARSLEQAKRAAEAAKTENPSTSATFDSITIDVEDDNTITQAFEHVSTKYGQLDCLVNNAGAQFDFELAKGNVNMREAWNKSWNVNVTGNQIMTHIFAPLLIKSKEPRLLFLTSGTASIQESEGPPTRIDPIVPKGWPKEDLVASAYRSSKVGLNMMMREWSRRLLADNVKVFAISPGFLATGLIGDPEASKKMGAGDPTLGGKFIKEVIEGDFDHQSGKAIRSHMVQPW